MTNRTLTYLKRITILTIFGLFPILTEIHPVWAADDCGADCRVNWKSCPKDKDGNLKVRYDISADCLKKLNASYGNCINTMPVAGYVNRVPEDACLRSPTRQHKGMDYAVVKGTNVTAAADGVVENRIINIPPGTLPAALTEATNYLNARLQGRTLEEAREEILAEMESHQAQLDEISTRLVTAGLAAWAGGKKGVLIIKGQANLLENIQAIEDLEKIRNLLSILEAQESMTKLLDLTENADGIQIYIGSENKLFNVSGCSMITAPYRNSKEKIIGAIGIIGPTRMNYARIIPLVDYTSQVISKLIG